MKRTILLIVLLNTALYAEPIQNHYLDSSAAYWMVEGAGGYLLSRSAGMGYTRAILCPIGFAIFKEVYVDMYKNDVFGMFDVPDKKGFDGTDIAFSALGVLQGFIAMELWDHRVRVAVSPQRVTLAVNF